MKNPIISVLMPVGNDQRFLKEAVGSIREQTFQSYEILLGENKEGTITKTLNSLAKKAKGEFLARMDTDDISEPDRFRKQVAFLRKHPNVQLVGTSASLINEKGETIGVQDMMTTWAEIKRTAFFKNPLIHPSWMMRKEWFEKVGGYNENFLFAQDWELLLRSVWKDGVANLPGRLLRLRIHKDSLSFRKNRQQVFYGLRARYESLRRGDVPFWKGLYLISNLFSLVIPTAFKFQYRKRS